MFEQARKHQHARRIAAGGRIVQRGLGPKHLAARRISHNQHLATELAGALAKHLAGQPLPFDATEQADEATVVDRQPSCRRRVSCVRTMQNIQSAMWA